MHFEDIYAIKYCFISEGLESIILTCLINFKNVNMFIDIKNVN